MTNSNGANDTGVKDFFKSAKTFGADSAKGKDGLSKLFHAMVRAAKHGYITLDRDSNGHDDANRSYAAYVQGMTQNAIHEMAPDSLKAQVSKLRQAMELGVSPVCDGVAIADEAFVARQDAIKADPKAKIRGAYNFYTEVARAQKASDRALTRAEIDALLPKPDAEVTAEKIIAQTVKKLEGLIEGKNGVQDTSPEVAQAVVGLNARLAALTLARQTEELIEKAAEMGISIQVPQVEQPEQLVEY